MRTWSDSPFSTQVEVSSVKLTGEHLGEGGQSRSVERIADRPHWVAKFYKSPLGPQESAVLDRMVRFPHSMTAREREKIDHSTAWPVSRITDSGRTVGVIMAEAPSGFYVPFNLRGGRRSEPKELQLDHLVNDSGYLSGIGVHPPSRQRRQEITCGFLELGVVLERHDVVYGDWSYRNALWDHDGASVFMLDMDSCGIGTRPWISSHEWTDPVLPEGSTLTVSSDRYLMALLSLRCLTGLRGEPLDSLSALEDDWPTGDGLPHLLRRAFTATDPSQRPRASELLDALRNPGAARPPANVPQGSNVTGFRPVRSRTGTQPPLAPVQVKPQPPAPTPTPAPAPASTKPQPPAPVKKSSGTRLLPLMLLVLCAALLVGFLSARYF